MGEHQGFDHGLFAGDEKHEKGIASARALTAEGGRNRRCGNRLSVGVWLQGGEDFVDRPIEQVNERVGVGQRRRGAFDPQQRFPLQTDWSTLGVQRARQSLLHGDEYAGPAGS